MKVEILSKKLIKPSIPTPTNLRTHKLSYLDQIAHPINASITLYYVNYDTIKGRLDKLEASLARVLSRFYPLAGRYIKENYRVDCNDQGAEFVVARVDCNLFEIINNPSMKLEDLHDLLPRDHCAVDEVNYPLLAVQVNKFKCGGLAICVSIPHRVFDAASVSTFITAWTSMHRGDDSHQATFPTFNTSLLFPSRNIIISHSSETRKKIDSTIACRRFLFNKNAISILRAKMMTSQELRKPPVSKVLLVFALIMKVLATVDRKKYGKPKDLLARQAINFRGKIVPPLSKYACGNFVIGAQTQCRAEQCQNMEYQDFVRSLGDSMTKTVAACGQLSSDLEKMSRALIDDVVELIGRSFKNGVNVMWFSDFTKFDFYEADFGWGKPIWVSLPNMYTKNFILLMDNKRTDQIEAWVHLDEKDMIYFEEDEEIKLLTSASLAVHMWAAL